MKRVSKKKTKILCTIGPSSLSIKTLRKMFEAGMNGARINTVFGNLREMEEKVENIRSVADLPILLDLRGVGIRTRIMPATMKAKINRGVICNSRFPADFNP